MMFVEIQNRWGPTVFYRLILFLTLLVIAVGCTTNRRVIRNESLDDWDGPRMQHKNLFPSKYGRGEETDMIGLIFSNRTSANPTHIDC
jgi:hypothetical protein